MKDIYELLPIRSDPLFENQEIILKDINDKDLFLSNYLDLEGKGIWDTILNIGKKLIGYIPQVTKLFKPATEALSDGSKFIDSSSKIYHSVKDFKKPKPKPTTQVTKPIKTQVKKETVMIKPEEIVVES